MDIENLHKIRNPYRLDNVRLSSREFVGREQAITEIKGMLANYESTARLQNIVISGEKSFGKTALLQRFNTILIDNNFEVFETDLSTVGKINEFEIIKDIIDAIYRKYDSYELPGCKIFDKDQMEIWYSLTVHPYEHESNYVKRYLEFPSQYASYKKGNKEQLSSHSIIRDFEKIIDDLLNADIDMSGFAILIDEAQMLQHSRHFIELLRHITANVLSIFVILCGLPTLVENKEYEKFSRTAIPIKLRGMMQNEILDLICKPLEHGASLNRFQALRLFHRDSLNEIMKRCGGNPLHVTIVCAKMFEVYQNSSEQKYLMLSRDVMEKVMEFYSTISNNSSLITETLRLASQAQLSAFKRLYYYEGQSIPTIVMIKMAFENVNDETRTKYWREIRDDMVEVDKLRLFQNSDDDSSTKIFNSYDQSMAPGVKYDFIGDAIDKLYVQYYFESIMKGEKLKHHEYESYENILAEKLNDEIAETFETKENISIHKSFPKLMSINNPENCKHIENNNFKDLQKLDDTDYESKTEKQRESFHKEISTISEKYGLHIPSVFGVQFGLENMIIIYTYSRIRGKDKLMQAAIPVSEDLNEINLTKNKLEAEKYLNASLEEYGIEILWIRCTIVKPKQYWVVLQVDKHSYTKDMLKYAKERKFKKALLEARRVVDLDSRYKKEGIKISAESVNNYAFCLLNVGDTMKAEEYLKESMKYSLISRFNYAYLFYINDDYDEALKIYKKIVKKQEGLNERTLVLNLCIKHADMEPYSNVVHDLYLYDVAVLNVALIIAQTGGSEHVMNSFLKRIKSRDDIQLYKMRTRVWIGMFGGKISSHQLIEETKTLAESNNIPEHLSNDLSNDIELFRKLG
jgi:hypothetical protein